MTVRISTSKKILTIVSHHQTLESYKFIKKEFNLTRVYTNNKDLYHMVFRGTPEDIQRAFNYITNPSYYEI